MSATSIGHRIFLGATARDWIVSTAVRHRRMAEGRRVAVLWAAWFHLRALVGGYRSWVDLATGTPSGVLR